MASPSPHLHILIFFTFLVYTALAFDPTAAPRPNRPPVPRNDNESDFVNPIKRPILVGRRQIHIRVFARIPNFASETVPGSSFPSKLVGMTYFGRDLYVTTSTAGALIYRVKPDGSVSQWADIARAVKRDTGRNVNCETTQHGGLRGLAFPPDFAKTGLFYVSYMEDRPARNMRGIVYFSTPQPFSPIVADSVVVEFRFNRTRGAIVRGSYRTVIRIGLITKDHPIKQIAFQRNMLLIAHGDGALGSNPSPGGMNNDGLGKVLRIFPKRVGNMPYTVPSWNPWVGRSKYKDAIFAVGFRNPHNICVSKRHGIFVADVGRDNIEEVNIVKAGRNYGWGAREGTFVNLEEGGTLTGIVPLPRNDAMLGYTYPNIQIGHFQPEGGQIRWGIAIAATCPVESNSPLKNIFLYCNFGERGELYYSWVGAMKNAKTRGPPASLTQANVYRAKNIFFDHDGNPNTPPRKVDSLQGLIRADGKPTAKRVDIRMGTGPGGEIYLMSKATGSIYLVTSTVKGARI